MTNKEILDKYIDLDNLDSSLTNRFLNCNYIKQIETNITPIILYPVEKLKLYQICDKKSINFQCKTLSCQINSSTGLPTSLNQYQTQKLIQNTVRVPSSVYIQNLRALTSYQSPSLLHNGVYWQQSSDRRDRHIQKVTVPTRGNSLKTSITRFDRPGCSTPGGAGVDMKHGSYQRYLNRIMAKKSLKREPIPPTFGLPIPFNPAFPIYGNKTLKTNIIDSCICNIIS